MNLSLRSKLIDSALEAIFDIQDGAILPPCANVYGSLHWQGELAALLGAEFPLSASNRCVLLVDRSPLELVRVVTHGPTAASVAHHQDLGDSLWQLRRRLVS